MRLNRTDQEEFRKRVKILFPQMEKREIVNHFLRGFLNDHLSTTIKNEHFLL